MKKLAKNKMATATLDLCRYLVYHISELNRNVPLVETLVESFVEGGYKKPLKFEMIRLNEDGMSKNY